MKTTKFFAAALFSIVVLTIATQGVALGNKLNKVFSKEFKVEKGTTLTIENKFGQVSIENWNKNEISINVEVVVDHPSKDRAERMLSAITVTLEQVGNEVRGITSIDDKLMKSVGGFSFGSTGREFRIDYKVMMPKNIEVNLRNKYGDMFIDELTGLANIDVKYGNLKANKILFGSNEPLSSLTLGYGNASIDEVDWMRLDIKYANVDIVKAKAVVALSKYSKIGISQASSLVIDSKYDTYSIGSIANIVGESGYTTYRIKRLDKKLDIKTRYGDVRVDEVSNSFEKISFSGSYASIYAPINASVSYNLDGESAYGGISYSTPAKLSRIETNNNLTVNGLVGTNDKTQATVYIRVRYGSAKLRD